METVIRVAITYVFVMVGLRLVGKRTFGKLSPPDLVILLLIPEFLSQGVLLEDFSLTNGMIAVSMLLLLGFLTEVISYRFPKAGSVVDGNPVTVVSHGFLRTHHMDKERLAPDEVLDAMQRAGLERMEQVKWAILYPDGTVAVVPWDLAENRPQASRNE